MKNKNDKSIRKINIVHRNFDDINKFTDENNVKNDWSEHYDSVISCRYRNNFTPNEYSKKYENPMYILKKFFTTVSS